MIREPKTRSINSVSPRTKNTINFMSKIKYLSLLILFCSFGKTVFTQSQDIDITQILSPAACLNNAGSYSVTIQLTNNGATNLNGIPVTLEFSLDGGANYSFPETFIPTTLNTTGNTETFTFSQPAVLGAGSTTNLVVRINPQIPGDNDLVDQLGLTVKVMTGFTMSSPTTCVATDIGFFDNSAGAIAWLWDFGDGNTSTAQNPTHNYGDTGTYNVTLMSNDGVCFGSQTQTVVVQPPVAAFALNPQIGCAIPHTVFFTDQSTLPDTWFWDFGDLNTSTLQNPVHNYTSAGNFTVVLTVTDTITGCSHTTENIVSVTLPNADFTYVGATTGGPFGCGPLTVDFLDASNVSGSATVVGWQWNFGDGNTSTAQNPTHTYNTPGTYTVSLTITLSNGCTDSHTILNYVTVSGPNVSFTPSVTSGCAPLTVTFTDNTLHSNPPVNYLWNFGDGNTSPTFGDVTNTFIQLDTFDVTLTVTDLIGCTASRTYNNLINTLDNIPPTISCIGNQNEYLNGSCQVILPDYRGLHTALDNCGIDSLQQSPAPGSVILFGTTVTITAVDFGSNMTSCSFNVTVSDTTKPTITCPGDIALNNDPGQCGAIVSYVPPFGNDNCAVATTVQTSGLSSGSLFPVGTTTNTFVVTDTAGNVDSCSFNVTVTDSEAPVITCPSNITQNNSFGDCDADVSYGTPVGTDNCPGAVTILTAGLPSNATFPVGTTTNTYVVTDASGSTATCSFDVTVVDAQAPSISCPGNITQGTDPGQCGATITFTDPVGTDNCPGSNTVQTGGLPSGSLFPVGTTTNTFEVTDGAGNTNSCSFDVVITDSESPAITCPADITQNNDAGQCGAVITYTAPTGTDNCPGATTVQTGGLTSGSLFPVGTTTNTFEVTDAAGNTTTCSFDVVINDTELPTITCPADIAQNNDAGQCGAIISFTSPVGLDNCPGATTVQIAGLASGSLFPVGTTTNTFEVTDAAGNTATCSFDVVITDSELPTITCPADIAQNNDAGQCGAIVTFTDPIGLDNCPGSTTIQIAGLTSGSLFPVGTTTNTFEVTDPSGNTATCSFDVVIADTELPTITCPANIAQNNDAGQCGAVITFADPAGVDNCPGSTTIQIAGLTSGSLFPVGTTTNTFEVTDPSGNTATCSFDVVITDTELPVITCPGDIAQNNDPGQCGAVVTFTDPIGTDNCPGATTVQIAGLTSGTLFPVGTTTNTFEVTDAAGNVATCSFDVVITDTELPVLICPGNIAQNNDPGLCSAVVTFVTPVGTDNCPGSTTVQTGGLPSGSAYPVGTTTNTFEVHDLAGNIAICSFDVVITDSEFPTITCPSNIAQDNDPGVCGALIFYTTPVGLDNCPGSTTIQTSGLSSGNTFPVGVTTNTFEVTDGAGNVTTCSFDIVISDTEFPTINCPFDIAQDNDPGVCGAVINYNAPVGLDNCPNSITVQTAGLISGDVFPVGTTTNTFEVTDASGNVTTCSFDVVITDTELPTITCPADIAQDNDQGVCGALVTFTDPVGLDNCLGPVTSQTAGLTSNVVYPIGTTTNTFEVVDMVGNTATCSFDIVITDAELPTLVCADSFESCDSVLTVDDPIVNDNCPNVVFELTSGLPSDTIFPVGITTNIYTATDSSGNQQTCEVEITRFQLPTIDAGDDLTIDAGKSTIIDAVSTNVNFFEWSPSEGLDMTSVEDPEADPMYTTTYSILVVSDDGCEATDSVNVEVNLVIEPNNFMSPNGDSKNDTWIIKGHYLLDDCTIRIYTSWGNLVHESSGYDNSWDGTFKDKELPEGNYYYVILCGSDDPVTGSITLIR